MKMNKEQIVKVEKILENVKKKISEAFQELRDSKHIVLFPTDHGTYYDDDIIGLTVDGVYFEIEIDVYKVEKENE